MRLGFTRTSGGGYPEGMSIPSLAPRRVWWRLLDAQQAKFVVFVAGLGVFCLMLLFSGGTGEAEQCVSAIAISPDGSLLAAGMYNSRDAQVPFKGYNADVCRTVKMFPLDHPGAGVVIDQEMRLGNQGPLHVTTPAMKFLDGGQKLAVLLNEGRLRVWDLATRRDIRSDISDEDPILGFDYSPDERRVALVRRSGLCIGHTDDANALHRIDDAHSVFWQAPEVAFSPDGRFVVATGRLRQITVWNIDTGKAVYELAAKQNESFPSVSFSVDSRLLAIASVSSIYVRNMETAQVQVIPAPPATGIGRQICNQVRFLPDNQTLAAVRNSGVALIDTERETVMRRMASSAQGAISCMAVSPRGDLLATGDDAGRVTLWDIASGSKTRELVIEGKYRTPWPVPAALLLIWSMLYRIVTKRRLFTWG